jgi:hypothetical protein
MIQVIDHKAQITSPGPRFFFISGIRGPRLCLAAWLSGCLAVSLAGCSLNRLAVRSTASVIDQGLPAIYREKDPVFARESLPANLKLMEVLLESDPGNQTLLLNTAMGLCGYGFMFIEEESEARASGLYKKGSAYALKVLELEGAVKDGSVMPAALNKRSAPAAFWHTFCRAAYVNLNRDDPDAVAELPKIMPVAERVAELAPAYYYNGSFAMLGTYHSLLPRILGGSPEKAKLDFDRSLEGAGADFLLNRYMAAKMYGVAAQDQTFFENALNEILAAELKDDEARLPNEVAKIKARKLLEKKNELF